VGYSIVRIVTPTFYSLQKSRIPVMVSMASVVVNVALNWWLVGVLGFRGLALGTATTALLNAGVQLWLVRRELSGIDGHRVIGSLARIVVAAAAIRISEWMMR
jgi:putative peptidoglycan lipid II flippase